MSNAALLQQTQHFDDQDWDQILHQLEQHWPIREQVSTALKEATAAFAAQFTQPDAYKYIEACARFTDFLNQKIAMDDFEQKSVLQILQIACAMHENAVNNTTLTPSQRSSHQIASTSLVALCKSVVEGSGITNIELWCEAFELSKRAHQAFSRAYDALNLYKCADMPSDGFFDAGSSASKTDNASLPGSFSSRISTRKPSLHDISDIHPSSLSAKSREDVLLMLKERPQGVPLGRAHTMPLLPTQAMPSSHSPRTTRRSSKAPSPCLSTLPEEE